MGIEIRNIAEHGQSSVTDLTIDTVGGGGALDELFNNARDAVIANIRDKTTDPGASREIVIKVGFKPKNDDRYQVGTSLSVISKLAPRKAIERDVFIGRKDGRLVAVTYDVNQRQLFKEDEDPAVAPVDEEAEVAS